MMSDSPGGTLEQGRCLPGQLFHLRFIQWSFQTERGPRPVEREPLLTTDGKCSLTGEHQVSVNDIVTRVI
ncbi:Hypothetical protein SMAX5B_010219 [Scophthalmus maximus]|uniref:Uncharacterized protein n=1 Tax=Scophthalmus maximus TaxID=52904 RepID=A0A2U9B5M3_SCOMX|nr:Hypothetical protein SMAX5B_010219 [Scophthalmus maximus]